MGAFGAPKSGFFGLGRAGRAKILTFVARAKTKNAHVWVIPRNQPGTRFMGWGQESVSTVLSPLLSCPEERFLVDTPLRSVDLGLTEQINVINTRAQAFFEINKQEVEKQFAFIRNTFVTLHQQFSRFCIVTGNSLQVFGGAF